MKMNRIWQLSIAVSVFVCTGCANTRTFSTVDFVPSGEKPIRSIGLVAPMNPQKILVADACGSQTALGVGIGGIPLFGLAGTALAGVAGGIAAGVESGDMNH